MSDVTVLHISQFKTQFLNAGAAKRNQNGGLRVDLDYNDPSVNVYLLQSPKVRLPFGVNDGMSGPYSKDSASYSLQMSFDNFKSSAPEAEFIRGIDAIDDHIKKLAAENSKVWFKKQMKLEVIDELYRPSLKYSEDWPPMFKVKLPQYQNKFTCQFWNKDQEKVTVDSLEKNCHVITLLQLQGLWFMDKMFGCSWVVKQVQAFPSTTISTKQCLVRPEGIENDENGENNSATSE